jgi:hypothetical protein
MGEAEDANLPFINEKQLPGEARGAPQGVASRLGGVAGQVAAEPERLVGVDGVELGDDVAVEVHG